jgi:putative hydroxymethylpyrimidine transport system permease protein
MMRRWTGPVAATIVALTVWQAVVWLAQTPAFILPGPLKVAESLVRDSEIIIENTAITFIEIALGLVIGAALGVATAIHLSLSPTARTFVLPVLVFSQAIPVFALAPILTLWFGYGLLPKVIMAVLIVYFPVASAFYDGLAGTPRGLIDLARVMGASRTRIMARVQIPAALPSLATGLRLAAVYAPIGAVIGEWVSASRGLGYLMIYANGRSKIDLMFAALFVLAIMTVVLRALIDLVCTRFLSRWTGETTRPTGF